MPEMVLDCPHCSSERIGFDFGGQHRDPVTTSIWNTFWICRKCREGIVVQLLRRNSVHDQPGKCNGDPTDEGFQLRDIHPKLQEPDIPEHIPEDIAKDFREAMDNMLRQNWTSTGMMLRKVLQRATTMLASVNGLNFQSKNLKSRISELANEGCITLAMREWADIIRVDGNDATHTENEEFSKEEAVQMASFTEIFLVYAFTLPERVRKHREKAQPVL